MELSEAGDIKLAVTQLYETGHGQALVKYLEKKVGFFTPAYNPEIESTIVLAAGREELMKVIRSLNELTAEQIVQLEGQ